MQLQFKKIILLTSTAYKSDTIWINYSISSLTPKQKRLTAVRMTAAAGMPLLYY